MANSYNQIFDELDPEKLDILLNIDKRITDKKHSLDLLKKRITQEQAQSKILDEEIRLLCGSDPGPFTNAAALQTASDAAPDLKSQCINELHLLLNDVNLEFNSRHHTLKEDLLMTQSKCKRQSEEISRLTRVLSNVQISPNEIMRENQIKCSTQVEQLTRENERLKSLLQQKSKKLSDMKQQIESLKRSLSILQNENVVLREKVLKSEERYQRLTYQRLMGHSELEEDAYAPYIEEYVKEVMAEEKKYSDAFLSKISLMMENAFQEIEKEFI